MGKLLKVWTTSILAVGLLAACTSPKPTAPSVSQTTTAPAKQEVPQPSAQPAPEPTQEDDAYETAIKTADFAKKLSQSALSIDDWDLAASKWQEAIETLESLPETNSNYELAQAKLLNFKLSLAATRQRQQPSDTFQVALQKGMEASLLTQKAQYSWEWKKVANNWKDAINLLKTVPQSTSNYETAQTKISEYSKNLEYAQSKVDQPITTTAAAVPEAGQTAPSIKPARSSRSGKCDCPYDRDSRGNRCGGRSAYSRPGGRSPICYITE